MRLDGVENQNLGNLVWTGPLNSIYRRARHQTRLRLTCTWLVLKRTGERNYEI